LVVSLTVGAIVIVVVAATSGRQQRFHRDVIAASERMERLDEATALLPIALRSIAPGEGDIPAGGARDTSLEFRATIATAVVCDSGHGSLVLAPVRDESPHLASILERPDVGDTLWSPTLTRTSESWTPHRITAVIDSTTACTIGGIPQWTGGPRTALVIRLVTPLAVGPGTPIRVTRLWRYSLYRASDGDWYLGAKEWNASSLRYNTIQPVSGPFASASHHGLVFSYADSSGVAVPSGSADTRRIALIAADISVDSLPGGRVPPTISPRSASVATIAIRNRAR
jgi:hypothetical protein